VSEIAAAGARLWKWMFSSIGVYDDKEFPYPHGSAGAGKFISDLSTVLHSLPLIVSEVQCVKCRNVMRLPEPTFIDDMPKDEDGQWVKRLCETCKGERIERPIED
jgi:hypothetical protein